MNITHRVAPGFVAAEYVRVGDIIRYAGETVRVTARDAGAVQVRLTIRPVDESVKIHPVAVIHGTAAIRRILSVAA